jgi:hypothetical protein
MVRLSRSTQVLAAAALALVMGTGRAQAQMAVTASVNPALAVTSPAGLDFGAVTKPTVTTVAFNAATTGILQVVGASNADIFVTFPLTVSFTGPGTPPAYAILPSSVGAKTISSGTCDRTGTSVVDVTTGTLNPNLGAGGILCYTVGGRLTTTLGTASGVFSGTLVLTVSY